MAREFYSASDAAQALGISLDTLRRWDRAGRITTLRDDANRRIVPAAEIDRLRGLVRPERLSARNRFPGIVRDIRMDGLMAQVEIEVTEPVRVVAVVTRDAVEDLGLTRGAHVNAVVKSTSVMLQD